MRDGCISGVAKKLNNPEICGLLLKSNQEKCIEWVNHKGIEVPDGKRVNAELI